MRIKYLFEALGISFLMVGCSVTSPKLTQVSIIAQASESRHVTIAYSRDEDRILAVVTRPENIPLKWDFAAEGGHEQSGHIAIVSQEGKEDITRSRCWYDITEDGVHKYQLGKISVGTLSNFVSAAESLSHSNFITWQQRKRSVN